MPFIEKAKTKVETSTATTQLDDETKADLVAYTEFTGKSQGLVIAEILRTAFKMDTEFQEFKRTRPVKGKRGKVQGNVESMSAA